MNMRNKYESNECEACGKNEEKQEHVLNCEMISNMHEEYEKEKIQKNGSVKENIKVAKLFIKNMKIIENLRKIFEKNNQKMILITQLGPSDQKLFIFCVCSRFIY